ncbi:SGNH/GDSL hydrolase family protein [Telluribacter humicola]|uniref:hypothetical protein n=1 Tax=Telluribacter humicola TaxID=1720261 RepID=UPI001A977008|nr:hypothetical protein [Telluribacter humicola]
MSAPEINDTTIKQSIIAKLPTNNSKRILASGVREVLTEEVDWVKQSLDDTIDYAKKVLVEAAQVAISTPTETPQKINLKNEVIKMCGDSTVEQGGSANMIALSTGLRKPGMPFADIKGIVNLGGSGFTLNGFLNNAGNPAFVGPSEGSSTWDYNLKKPVGAVPLADALKVEGNIWMLCYGINDCILNAAVGNLSQAEISDYIAERLIQAVTRIRVANPEAIIIFRIPNPMTARPWTGTYPSSTQYPTFGQDLAADQALVEKWNQGLRNGYLIAYRALSRTILFDTWEKVFGVSDTTKLATTELPLLGDMVHPNTDGQVSMLTEFALLLNPYAKGEVSRRYNAEKTASARGGNAADYYSGYYNDNQYYEQVLDANLVSSGVGHIDLGVSQAQWNQLVPNGVRAYVEVIGVVAYSLPANYTANVHSASVTRLLNVIPPAVMQGTTGRCRIYVDRVNTIRTKLPSSPYLMGRITAANPRKYFRGTVTNGNSGFLDITFNNDGGRGTSRYLKNMGIDNYRKLVLEIGGNIQAPLSLSGATFFMNGTAANRVLRITKTGEYASYIGAEVLLYVDDNTPDPAGFEVERPGRGVCEMLTGAKGRVVLPTAYSTGIASITAAPTVQVPSAITLEVYRYVYPTGRGTSLGTITIAANAASGSLASIPSNIGAQFVAEGELFEFVVTSGTSGYPDELLRLTVNPVI